MENFIALYFIQAKDRDSGINAQVVYGFSLPVEKISVTINASNGAILLNSQIDYEMVRTVEIQVVATDRGTPSLQDTEKLTVNIKVW